MTHERKDIGHKVGGKVIPSGKTFEIDFADSMTDVETFVAKYGASWVLGRFNHGHDLKTRAELRDGQSTRATKMAWAAKNDTAGFTTAIAAASTAVLNAYLDRIELPE